MPASLYRHTSSCNFRINQEQECPRRPSALHPGRMDHAMEWTMEWTSEPWITYHSNDTAVKRLSMREKLRGDRISCGCDDGCEAKFSFHFNEIPRR